MLLFSLVEFIIYYFTGISLVSKHVVRSNGQEFQNLVFNLVKEGGFPRFQSLADEPGLIGTICGLLLFVVGRNPKQYQLERIIIIISGVFTFSIAFFFLAAISLLSHNINLKTLFFVALVLIAVYYIFYDIVYSRIFIRFVDGTFDNRATYEMRKAVLDAWNNGDLWLGCGLGAHESMEDGLAEDGGAGAIVFIYEFGIIGTLLVFLLYSLLVIKNSWAGAWGNLLYLLAFWASFYQRQTIDRPYTIMAFIAFSYIFFTEDITRKRTGSKKVVDVRGGNELIICKG